MNTRIAAWAHGLSPEEVTHYTSELGIGAVLYPSNYKAANRAGFWIAYVSNPSQARQVDERFSAVIVLDERNHTGPSGTYLTPEQYRKHYESIREELPDTVPVSTMGLAPVGPWWRNLLWCLQYDRGYHLPSANLRAFNPNKVRREEVLRALDLHDRWILSPAPFRTWWERLVQPVPPEEWIALAHEHDVTVAFWCLRETKHFLPDREWQGEHGLFDRHGNLTVVGRSVKESLKGYRR